MCVRAHARTCVHECVHVYVYLQMATPTRSQQRLVVQRNTTDPGMVYFGVVEGSRAVFTSVSLAKHDIISDVSTLNPVILGALRMTRRCGIMTRDIKIAVFLA